MHNTRRAATVIAATASVLAMGAGSAFAHQCVNPDKQSGAGAQILVNFTNGEITFLTEGMQRRFESGVTTEDSFRGLMGLDFDGNGEADVTTWIVGKLGEIPMKAQEAGAACHGVINAEAYMECLQGELAS